VKLHSTNGTPPRRILLVETNHDGTFGGSHRAMFDLVRHLDRDRYLPVALFYEDNPLVNRLRADGFHVLTWDEQWRREHGAHARWFRPRRLMGFAEAITRRVALLRGERIDLVHINNSPSYSYYDWLPAARLVGIPCVTHLRGELYPINNKLIHWLACRFDRYIAISSYVNGLLKDAHFPCERISQIEDGVDGEELLRSVKRSPSSVREELGVTAHRLLVVMAGHLRDWKGQDVVLLALAALPSEIRSRIYLVFAGADDPHDVAYRRRLDDLVRTHNLDSCCRFLGGRRDVPDLMNAADVVLHASTRPEPFGLVVLEGMALGRLVIASALGGPLEIMTDGGGWTFDPRKPAELSALLWRVVENPGLVTAHADVAIARAQEFTAQRTTSRVQSVYDELLA